MNIFSLTETEFFRKLTEGKKENLHIAYKEFVLQVSELCNKEPHKGCVISALLFVEVEISHLQTAAQRQEVNDALVSFINRALCFVRQTLSHYKEIDFRTVGEENMLDRLGLDWKANKTDLIELGYAFKVALLRHQTKRERYNRQARPYLQSGYDRKLHLQEIFGNEDERAQQPYLLHGYPD